MTIQNYTIAAVICFVTLYFLLWRIVDLLRDILKEVKTTRDLIWDARYKDRG
jgi:hypothetical protein